MTDRLQLTDQLHRVLREAAQQRDLRGDLDPATGELGWVLFERQQMLGAVNRAREAAGRALVTEDQVRVAAMTATGHIDYAQKFALRCADLALEE